MRARPKHPEKPRVHKSLEEYGDQSAISGLLHKALKTLKGHLSVSSREAKLLPPSLARLLRVPFRTLRVQTETKFTLGLIRVMMYALRSGERFTLAFPRRSRELEEYAWYVFRSTHLPLFGTDAQAILRPLSDARTCIYTPD